MSAGDAVTLDTPAAKLADLAHAQLGEMSDVQDARGLAGVLGKFQSLKQRPRAWRAFLRPRRLLVGSFAAALVLATVLLGPAMVKRQPLTYVMTDGEIQVGGYFRIGAHAQPSLRFSDGTSLTLKGGARGRLTHVDAHGARVTLDEGEAHVAVVPRPDGQWLFDAGPFLVRVHGTEFDLAWNGGEGRLDVRLLKGAVSVAGPVSDQALSLHAGQWLTVHLASHEVFVRNIDQASPTSLTPATVETTPTIAPPPALEAPVVPSPEPSTRTTSHHFKRHPVSHASIQRPAPLDWGSARAAGDWNRILESASQVGLDRTLAERSSEDLALLADAAHYLHRDDVAERSLLAQRRRFPDTTRAKDAAFLLGRITESRPGGAEEALAWYDRHLQEAPTGVYASEALGRKMTVLGRTGGERAARPIADEYLRRYPAGTYARAARAYAKQP
jgi:hypothetical protein